VYVYRLTIVECVRLAVLIVLLYVYGVRFVEKSIVKVVWRSFTTRTFKMWRICDSKSTVSYTCVMFMVVRGNFVVMFEMCFVCVFFVLM